MTRYKSLNSNGLASQKKIGHELSDPLKPLRLQLIKFDQSSSQPASIQDEVCDCDPIVNGKSGRICQTHLFRNLVIDLKMKRK